MNNPMTPKQLAKARGYVAANASAFHARRRERLNKLNLTAMLRQRNPYLFKIRNVQLAHDVVKFLLDDSVQQKDSVLLGEFFEEVTVFVGAESRGDDNLYLQIVELLGQDDAFAQDYTILLNKFTGRFLEKFCIDGEIRWEKVVEFNSGKKKAK